MLCQTFVVEGKGRFPFDMLRRDCCYPADECESGGLETPETNRNATRRVTLRRIVAYGWNAPTTGRWESFGWKVVEVKNNKLP